MPKLPRQDLDHVLEHVGERWTALAGTRLFLTGGTGFVGKWLVESLLWANDHRHLGITAVLLTRDPQRFERECPHLARHPAIELLQGDVCRFDFPDGEFQYVIHAATERSAAPTSAEPTGAFDRDIEGTRRMLDFARRHGTQRLLFTSSGAVYGTQPPGISHVAEDYPGAPLPEDSTSSYGQAKRVSEFLCAMHARHYGFSALIARLFAFSGPYLPLDENYAVGNFIGNILAGRPIHIKGDGTPYRSYLYAADLAVWLWVILTEGRCSRPYNVGSAEQLTIVQLAHLIQEMAGAQTGITIAGQPQPGVPAPRYVPCTKRAAGELGLTQQISLQEGLRRTISWHRQ